MAITLTALKTQRQDYLVARWDDDHLVMEPFCSCGESLDENYHCRQCERECDCTFIACEDPQALSIVEKLIQGNPSFKNYKASLLDQ